MVEKKRMKNQQKCEVLRVVCNIPKKEKGPLTAAPFEYRRRINVREFCGTQRPDNDPG